MLFYLIVLTFVFTGANAAPTKICSDIEYRRLKEEYALCVAAPMVKYRISEVRGGNVSVCDVFEEMFEHCVNIWSPCANESEIRELTQTETQQIITAMSAEGEVIDYSNCSIFKQFNITKLSEEQLVFGQCNTTELSNAEKSSWKCGNDSLSDMKRQIQLAEDKKEETSKQFCSHMERALSCYSELRRCLNTPEEWQDTKNLFILGARVAVEKFQNSGFHLPKCKVLEKEEEP